MEVVAPASAARELLQAWVSPPLRGRRPRAGLRGGDRRAAGAARRLRRGQVLVRGVLPHQPPRHPAVRARGHGGRVRDRHADLRRGDRPRGLPPGTADRDPQRLRVVLRPRAARRDPEELRDEVRPGHGLAVVRRRDGVEGREAVGMDVVANRYLVRRRDRLGERGRPQRGGLPVRAPPYSGLTGSQMSMMNLFCGCCSWSLRYSS